MLQSAAIRDGGNKKSNSRFTRLLAYDISQPAEIRPALVAEYIVPLPQDSDGKTLAASEIAFVGKQQFLVLSRDSNGHGGDDTTSAFKFVLVFASSGHTSLIGFSSCRSIVIVDISGATNIAGSSFDSHKNPVAPKGKLDKSVTAATYTTFLSLIDSTQLSRFGLHNGQGIPYT